MNREGRGGRTGRGGFGGGGPGGFGGSVGFGGGGLGGNNFDGNRGRDGDRFGGNGGYDGRNHFDRRGYNDSPRNQRNDDDHPRGRRPSPPRRNASPDRFGLADRMRNIGLGDEDRRAVRGPARGASPQRLTERDIDEFQAVMESVMRAADEQERANQRFREEYQKFEDLRNRVFGRRTGRGGARDERDPRDVRDARDERDMHEARQPFRENRRQPRNRSYSPSDVVYRQVVGNHGASARNPMSEEERNEIARALEEQW